MKRTKNARTLKKTKRKLIHSLRKLIHGIKAGRKARKIRTNVRLRSHHLNHPEVTRIGTKQTQFPSSEYFFLFQFSGLSRYSCRAKFKSSAFRRGQRAPVSRVGYIYYFFCAFFYIERFFKLWHFKDVQSTKKRLVLKRSESCFTSNSMHN